MNSRVQVPSDITPSTIRYPNSTDSQADIFMILKEIFGLKTKADTEISLD